MPRLAGYECNQSILKKSPCKTARGLSVLMEGNSIEQNKRNKIKILLRSLQICAIISLRTRITGGILSMQHYSDCPQILRDFLTYHETIKGQSQKTISEYHLDLRMFLRFMRLMRSDMPIQTPLEDIPIRDIDVEFLRQITTSDVFEFLSYLANERNPNPDSGNPELGIAASSRARKLSAIKSFFISTIVGFFPCK